MYIYPLVTQMSECTSLRRSLARCPFEGKDLLVILSSKHDSQVGNIVTFNLFKSPSFTKFYFNTIFIGSCLRFTTSIFVIKWYFTFRKGPLEF